MGKVLFETNSEVMGGRPCFIGTRIPADTIQSYWANGFSPDAIHLEYPTLSKNKIVEAFKVFAQKEPKDD